MRLRAVLFDLDGTLVDHDGAVDAALRGWLPTLGVTPEPSVLHLWQEIQERHMVAWRERRVTFAEQRRRPAARLPAGRRATRGRRSGRGVRRLPRVV